MDQAKIGKFIAERRKAAGDPAPQANRLRVRNAGEDPAPMKGLLPAPNPKRHLPRGKRPGGLPRFRGGARNPGAENGSGRING